MLIKVSIYIFFIQEKLNTNINYNIFDLLLVLRGEALVEALFLFNDVRGIEQTTSVGHGHHDNVVEQDGAQE